MIAGFSSRSIVRVATVTALAVVPMVAHAGPPQEDGAAPAASSNPTAPTALETGVLGFADDLLEDAEYYRAIGEYERYLFQCTGCVKRDYAVRRMADAYRAGGELQRAVDLYERVLAGEASADERRAAAWGRAQTLSQSERYADAAAAFSAYASEFPSDSRSNDARWESIWSRIRARELDAAATQAADLPEDHPRKEDAQKLTAELRTPPRLSHRSPLLAGILSGVLPGAGQGYVGRWRDAISALLMNALWASAAVIAWQQGWDAAAIVVGTGEVFWYAGNIYGAVTAAHRYNNLQERFYYEDLEDRYLGSAPQARLTVTVPVLALRF